MMSQQHDSTLSPDDVLVRPQPTPNPSALKFIVNQPLKREGKATINAPEETPELKLVEGLFQIEGVKQLHFFQNTVTITHQGHLAPEELIEQVVPVLKTRVPVHNPDFGEPAPQKGTPRDRKEMSEEQQMVEEILDRTIRPGLQADGGDVEVIKIVDNEIHILYQGACGGCPSAMMGTLDAIQSILRHELGNPELSVIPL